MRQDLESDKAALRLADCVPACFPVASAGVAFSSRFVSINEGHHSEIGNVWPDASRDRYGFCDKLAGENVAFIAETGTDPSAGPCVTYKFGKRP